MSLSQFFFPLSIILIGSFKNISEFFKPSKLFLYSRFFCFYNTFIAFCIIISVFYNLFFFKLKEYSYIFYNNNFTLYIIVLIKFLYITFIIIYYYINLSLFFIIYYKYTKVINFLIN